MSIFPHPMIRRKRRPPETASDTGGVRAATAHAAGNAKPPASPAPNLSSENSAGILVESVSEGHCPKCERMMRFNGALPLSETICSSCGTGFLTPGRLDDFLLLERIGVGEMGEIYRALDETLHRSVAIKVVRAARADDKTLRERLHQEARAAASLCHPRVAQVHALGFSNGHPYLVMELVQGEDMNAKLQQEDRIEECAALRVAINVAEGLHALHKKGLTHGDIKPANIVLDDDGAAKLVDFGLSGMARRDSTGTIFGTPHYIAPESLRGERDSRGTDLYSLGATLYHLLSGRTPFQGADPTEIARARLVRPPDPIGRHAPDISPATQHIVTRLLNPNPVRRYPDAAALMTDMRKALNHLEPTVRHDRHSNSRAAHQAEKTAAQAPSGLRRYAGYLLLTGLSITLAFMVFRIIREQTMEPATSQSPAATAPPDPGLRIEPEGAEFALPAFPSEESIGWQLTDPGETTVATHGFSRILTPQWTSTGIGNTVSGSTVWKADGTLILQVEGHRRRRGRSVYRYAHTDAVGDVSFSAQLTGMQHLAKTGLMIRDHSDGYGSNLFFGVLDDGTLLLEMDHPGFPRQRILVSPDPLPLPFHLRMAREGDSFAAFVSEDGMAWQQVAEGTFPFPAQAKIGLAVTSHTPETIATVEFRDILLTAPTIKEHLAR